MGTRRKIGRNFSQTFVMTTASDRETVDEFSSVLDAFPIFKIINLDHVSLCKFLLKNTYYFNR
jgi:hypothetical protein